MYPTAKELGIEIGNRYGMLVVLQTKNSKTNRPIKTNHQKSGCKCKCDCGNNCIVRLGDLLRGHTKSCGCKSSWHPNFKGLTKDNITLCYGRRLYSYKYKAKQRGHKWQLSTLDAIQLMKSPCYYCGEIDRFWDARKSCYTNFKLNGIDRLENVEGYTILNSVSCCGICNKIKERKSIRVFMKKVRTIYNHLNLSEPNNLISLAKRITTATN